MSSGTMSAPSEVSVCLEDQHLKYLNKVAKRPPVDLEFEDLKFTVRDYSIKGGWRQILNSVNGKFLRGEMTVIMGPSGAGKSTLLNILAGYVISGTEGTIKVNGGPRSMATFKKMSAYIMQENIIQPHLSVKEAMLYATKLKLSTHIKHEDMVAVIEEVLDLLGLTDCVDVISEFLSGGQRKRLTIALELVNNPPVIFLDEPTTGLDDFAVKQCITLLKKISQLDRTVVLTLHQPSSALFKYFDQVYIMADGNCVYNGRPAELVNFFTTAGYDCPSSYTPADYMIELVNLSPTTIDVFSKACQNGKKYLKSGTTEEIDFEMSELLREHNSFQAQFLVLLSRRFLQMRRNMFAIFLQIFHHFFSAFIISGIFVGVGNDAANALNIIKYCLCINVFFSYTYVMAPAVTYPFEVRLLKMEYFNRWYSLKSYYAALTVSTFPLLVVLTIFYCIIVYLLTDQPIEMNRFIGFCLIALLVALISQSLGYLIGAAFTVMEGAVVGPLVLACFIVLAVYGVGQKNAITPFFDLLLKTTFLRDGIVGLCSTLLYQRKHLACSELYCHYEDPELLMRDNSMNLIHYTSHIAHLFIFLVLFRMLGYLVLKCKLNTELCSKITYQLKKVIHFKQMFD